MAGGADGPHHDPQNIQNPSVCLGRARVRACSRHWVRLRLTNGAGGAALFDIVNVQNWTRRRISGPFKQRRFRTGSGAAILLSICQAAGLAHRAEHSPRKREAGGSSPPASTTLSLGRNRPVAGHRFGKAETGVRSAVAAPSIRFGNALVAKRQTQPPQKRPPQGMEVQVLPGAPFLFARRVEDTHFVLWRHTNPTRHARFAKRPRHRSYTPTFPGSSPGASTRNRFVSLAAKAPARHAGDPRFESATKHRSSLP